MKEHFTSFFSDIALQPMSTSEKVLKFTSSVRGIHYYQRIWSPKDTVAKGYGRQRIRSPKDTVAKGYGRQRIRSPKDMVAKAYGRQSIWSPKAGEKLNCYHERAITHSMFLRSRPSPKMDLLSDIYRERYLELPSLY